MDDDTPTKYPNKVAGLTDEEVDANEARRPTIPPPQLMYDHPSSVAIRKAKKQGK